MLQTVPFLWRNYPASWKMVRKILSCLHMIDTCTGASRCQYQILSNTSLYILGTIFLENPLLWVLNETARVDVSETFSADQLWFRILSGLFQRCSLPENLWTALIQLWTALKTEIFRTKNQRWNSAVQLWNRADSELNSADFLWHSAEKPKIQSKENQLWISAVSALIFPERELIPTEAFLNSFHHSWFSPETTLNIQRHLILFPQTSAGKLRYWAFLEI